MSNLKKNKSKDDLKDTWNVHRRLSSSGVVQKMKLVGTDLVRFGLAQVRFQLTVEYLNQQLQEH
jgi:hypothetical protein